MEELFRTNSSSKIRSNAKQELRQECKLFFEIFTLSDKSAEIEKQNRMMVDRMTSIIKGKKGSLLNQIMTDSAPLDENKIKIEG
jgi:hypothetical protein